MHGVVLGLHCAVVDGCMQRGVAECVVVVEVHVVVFELHVVLLGMQYAVVGVHVVVFELHVVLLGMH
jgi:hypothetical protein